RVTMRCSVEYAHVRHRRYVVQAERETRCAHRRAGLCPGREVDGDDPRDRSGTANGPQAGRLSAATSRTGKVESGFLKRSCSNKKLERNADPTITHPARAR